MTIEQFLGNIVIHILQPLVGLMFVVALVIFFWGIVQFIGTSNTDEGRETGKRNLVWGIVGILIMVSVYGIISILLGTFGISKSLFPYLGI